MIKLQNNFTTPEQSKRLLELGVPADSADCSIDEWERVHKIPQENGNLLFSQLKRQTIYTIRPCWSVGRLIEIWEVITEEKWSHETKQSIIEELISNFSYYSYDNDDPLDFSKLEE